MGIYETVGNDGVEQELRRQDRQKEGGGINTCKDTGIPPAAYCKGGRGGHIYVWTVLRVSSTGLKCKGAGNMLMGTG